MSLLFLTLLEFLVYFCVSQKYFKNADASAVSPATAVSPVTAVTAVSPVAGLTDVQQQMVQQFSVQSGMNASWSARYHSITLHYVTVKIF